MKIEEITIANLSCNGCVNTITKKLKALAGVQQVKVDLESSMVSVETDNQTERHLLTQTLQSIGYPEITDKNDLFTKLKSVTSCMTGKISGAAFTL